MLKVTGWALVGGFAALMVTACSGAESVNDAPVSAVGSEVAAAPEKGEMKDGADGRRHRDPAELLKRLDKDGNGTVELAEIPEHKQKWLGKADTNSDGKLTVDELKAAGAARQREKFQRADENNDGALTSAEVGEDRWSRIQVADTNADSKITLAEMEQAHADGKLRPMHDKGGKHGKGPRGDFDPAKMVEKLDKDKSGALEASELPERMDKLMERADANKDGKLTAEEMKQHAASRPDHPHGKKGPRGRGAPESL
jgi:Ca2+-binding EF-hand superfamily protein